MKKLGTLSEKIAVILLGCAITIAGYGAYSLGQVAASEAYFQSLSSNLSAIQTQYSALSASLAQKDQVIAGLQESCQNLTEIVSLEKSELIDSVQTWVPYHHVLEFDHEMPYAGYLNITFEANKAVVFYVYGDNFTYLVKYPQTEAGVLSGQFIAPVMPGHVTVEIRQVIGDMWHIDYRCTYVY